MIKEITNEELMNECRRFMYLKTNDVDKLFEVLSEIINEEDLQLRGNGVRVYGDVSLNELFKVFNKHKIEIESINTVETSIEEYYLKMVKA